MANLTLSINSEIYNYETLYNIYKKLSSKIIDVRLETTDDISDRSRIIEGIFYINDNGSIVTIENIVFLHLLVFSYFVELENSENDDLYKTILNSFIQENIKYYEKELEKSSEIYFENEKRKKVYDILAELIKTSENVFGVLVSSITKNARMKILGRSVELFNRSNNKLDSILKEKSSVNIKLEKCYLEIRRIFEIDFSDLLNEYGDLDKINTRSHLLWILEDSIKAIYTYLILDREKEKENLEISFNEAAWFVYFYSLLLSSYRENRINLLKLNKDIDFLKFGADTGTIDEILNKFVKENSLSKIKKEMKPEIFYLLLGMGYYNKAVYSSSSVDRNCEIVINLLDRAGNKIFDEGLKVYRLNTGFIILDFINMIIKSNNINLKKYVIIFVEKINYALDQINNLEDVYIDIGSAISDIFNSLEGDMLEKYYEIKLLYNTSTKQQKINLIKELINILVHKVNINLNNRKDIIRNYKTAIKSLENKMDFEIQIEQNSFPEDHEDHVSITHNIIDSVRLRNEKLMKKILETNFRSAVEWIREYPSDIEEIETEKNISAESVKKKLLENCREKSRIIIKVRRGEGTNGKNDINLIIYTKIFYFLIIYDKIKNNKYFIGLEEKYKKIYFEIAADIIYMLNLKDNFLLQNMNNIVENEYLDYFLEKTEEYFLSVYLNSEEHIKKINPEMVKESEELLNIFKKALIDSYLYYEEGVIDFEKEEVAFEEDEKYFDSFDIKNKNILSKDSKDGIDYLIESSNLEKIFV